MRSFGLTIALVVVGCGARIVLPRDDASKDRPDLTVPTLTQVRDILALLEGPIVTTLVERAALPAEPALYANNGQGLLNFIKAREVVAAASGRFDYGTLEYPFTQSLVAPDKTSSSNPFPPGRFHQDTFSPNANLTSFYLNTLIPLIRTANTAAGSSSVFFHLTSPTPADADAKYNLDATLLALISHRSSIGKVVGESKFAANVSGFTPLIKLKDATTIQVLLTNVTQEEVVLEGAASASLAVATAWETAQTATTATTAAFVASIQAATAKLFRELIDITTQVEVEYILQRLV